MNKEDSTYQLIEDYLTDNLNSEGRKAFESRMEIDSNFKMYVEQHKLANKVIIAGEINRIQDQLQTLHLKKSKLQFYLKVGLLVLFGFGVFVGLLIINQKESKTIYKKQILNFNLGETSFISKKDINLKETKIQKKSEDKVHVSKELDSITYDEIITRANNIDTLLIDLPSAVETNPETDGFLSIGELEFKNEAAKDKKIQELTSTTITTADQPCNEYYLELSIETKPTCENKSEGQIIVEQSEQFKAFRLLENNTTSKKGFFKDLRAGEYSLIGIDSNGCYSLPKNIIIESYICDFMIQPDQQIFWEIPIANFNQELLTLEIYDAKSGRKVVGKVIDEFSESQWNGEGDNGSILPMGSYVYRLYSMSKSLQGSITIVR